MSIMTLTQIPLVLKEMTNARVTYDRIYRMVINGDLPAERALGGRWVVKEADLPEYIAKLKLTEKSHG